MFDSIFDLILLKNDDDSEITALQTKKRNNKVSSETLDWFKFIQACFMSLIAILICSFLSCNIILIGLIHPEIIHPTIPCAPPYAPPRDSDKFKYAIDFDEKTDNNFKQCYSYDLSQKYKTAEDKIYSNVSPEIENFYKEIRHNKQGHLYKIVSSVNNIDPSWNEKSLKKAAVTGILVVMRSCLLFREGLHSFHQLIRSCVKEQRTRIALFFVLMFFILWGNIEGTKNKDYEKESLFTVMLNGLGLGYLGPDTSNLFGLPMGINFFSMYNFILAFIITGISGLIMMYSIVIEYENNFLPLLLFGGTISGVAFPLINLFISMDFMYYYLLMPLFNAKARGVITCMMANEFSKIIAFIYSIFVFNNARAYLDTLTSDIVFYVLLVLNLRSLYNYMKEDKVVDASIPIGNCDMKQHLYKNINIQNVINKPVPPQTNKPTRRLPKLNNLAEDFSELASTINR